MFHISSRFHITYLNRLRIITAWLVIVLLPTSVWAQYGGAAASVEASQPHSPSWTFVSFPDFFNFDIPYPWAQWEPAISWFLNQVKAEDPSFVLIAGDLVNGHWWDGPRTVEQMGALYYGGWVRRMKDHGLTYYTAIGDHELGDDPWPEEKAQLVPHLRRVYNQHLKMPQNGPKNKKGLAYYVRHGNVLIITVETFELVDNQVFPRVNQEQLDWFKNVVDQHSDAEFIVVQGHNPVFGEIKSRSSSRLMHEGGKSSGFWQVMKDAGVDLYLCGEHHDVTVLESDGMWQIVHGSSWGRKVVDDQNYLVCDIYPGRMELEMKNFPMEAKGDNMWNLHKDRGPREIVEIPHETRRQGPQVIGTLTIKNEGDQKTFSNITGVFE